MSETEKFLHLVENQLNSCADKALERILSKLITLLQEILLRRIEETHLISLYDHATEKLSDPEIQPVIIYSLISQILTTIERHQSIVKKHYYTNRWTALGLLIFGVPAGIIVALISNVPLYFPLALPIGIPLGMLIGHKLDHKAELENRVLNFDYT